MAAQAAEHPQRSPPCPYWEYKPLLQVGKLLDKNHTQIL